MTKPKETSGPSPSLADWVDESSAAKAVGGGLAMAVGIAPGVARGAWHLAEGLGNGADFVGRLLDPYDAYYSPPGQAAWDALPEAGQAAYRYVDRVRKDPDVAIEDLHRWVADANTKLNPHASKPAATFGGELRRNLDIGMNRGEALFNVGSVVVGGAELKGLAELGFLQKGGQVEKYLARGYPPRVARYMAEPYNGPMGAHFVPRSTKLPEYLGGGPAPKWLLDNPFNVIKPRGVDKGAMYERHFKTDPQYNGGRLRGGGGWSGERLGWRKYGPAGRIFYGAPGPLKAALTGGLAGIGAVVDNVLGGKRSK